MLRLHQAMRAGGHDSTLLVRHKRTTEEHVHEVSQFWISRRARLRRFLTAPARKPPSMYLPFNLDSVPEITGEHVCRPAFRSPDLILLHWLTGFLTVKTIRELHDYYDCPVVWNLLDQEPLTGGCHYSLGCDGFKRECGRCPQLGSEVEHDASRRLWRRKRELLSPLPIIIGASTCWAIARTNESSLFRGHRIESIPLALDTELFRPIDRRIAREVLRIPQDKRVIFFAAYATDRPQKGMVYLKEALSHLARMVAESGGALTVDEVLFVTAGEKGRRGIETAPFPVKELGLVKDEVTLALAYQAADIFVCSSIEDAGPMMIPEAMLCGTPVVAFDSGGAPDVVSTMKTGYLAKYRDSADLARGVHELLMANDIQSIAIRARKAVEEKHNPLRVAKAYADLCESLLESRVGAEQDRN